MEQLPSLIWIGFAIIVVGGLLLLWLLTKLSKPKPQSLPYVATPLLTPNEKRFFTVLMAAIPNNCYLSTQVRLASLVRIRPGVKFSWKQFNPIAMKTVDFVVIHRVTLNPVLVVELDDKSHERRDRRERDQFVDRVLASVSLPILHWPAATYYNKAELERAIQEKL